MPSDLLENMMFFSRKSQTAEERLRLLQKCLNARNPAFGSGMPRSWGCDEPGLTSAAGTAQP